MFYKGKTHKRIFKEFVENSTYKYSKNTLAVIYLLSADKLVWRNSREAVSEKIVNPNLISLTDATPYGYMIAKVAIDIANGTTHLTFNDLTDKYLTADYIFEMIVTALRIARKGYDYIGIKKQFE